MPLHLTDAETINVLYALSSHTAAYTAQDLADPRRAWESRNIESAIEKLETYLQELSAE